MTLSEAGEIAQWLGTLTTCPEDPCLIPSTQMVIHNYVCSTSSRGLGPLYWPQGTFYTCSTQAGKHNTHEVKINIF